MNRELRRIYTNRNPDRLALDYYNACNQSDRKKRFLLTKPTIPSAGLISVKDIVAFSFIVHRSITSLDLSLREFSDFKREMKRKPCKNEPRPFISEVWTYRPYHTDLIGTEESCKRRLARDRKLLYKYHLDVSKKLDVSLRNAERQDIRECYSEGVLLNNIVVLIEDYARDLIRIMREALKKTDQTVRLIHKACKILKHSDFSSYRIQFRDNWLSILCYQRADSTIVKDFLITMGYEVDDYFDLFQDVFEFVLDNVGYDLWPHLSESDPIHRSILSSALVKVKALFRFRDCPRFSDTLYADMKRRNRLGVPEVELNIPVQIGLITKERHFLILEVLDVFFRRRPNRHEGNADDLKALQLLWRSVPDPFITRDELALVCAKPPDSEIIQEISEYLEDVTEEEVREEKGLQPRMLIHYCRTLIRRLLCSNRRLATGIGELGLPKPLVSFLKLE